MQYLFATFLRNASAKSFVSTKLKNFLENIYQKTQFVRLSKEIRSQQNNIASKIRQKLNQYYKAPQDSTLLFCFKIKGHKDLITAAFKHVIKFLSAYL